LLPKNRYSCLALDVKKFYFLSGEKINLKFEVSSARPLVYEWLKQGIREDVTLSPPEVSGGINLKFEVSSARPLVYEWLKQGIREVVTLSPPEVSGGINLRC
jgi:hypothetical protein